VHSEASFLHPLKYGDTAFCKINVTNIGNSSITWSYELSNQDGKICWSAIQTTVCTNMDSITEKTNVPDWIREGLEKIMI
jgi:acyl-CoA thioesterase FadM